MPGAPEPEYVVARKVLLDALEALGEQKSAVVLVGAQAVYLHTGDADLAVAPYTTDGDIALDPSKLKEDPKLAEALKEAGFAADVQQVGTWVKSRPLRGEPVEVRIDLMVPEAVGGLGSRGARLGVHGKRTARKAKGLEASLVDQQRRTIRALDDEDDRNFEVTVAGPAALLVAKLHKIAERVDTSDRSKDKDALDVFRLLRSVPTEFMAHGVHALLNGGISAAVTEEALTYLRNLFYEPSRPGCRMAARAAAPEPEDTITASCAVLTQDLLQAVSS